LINKLIIVLFTLFLLTNASVFAEDSVLKNDFLGQKACAECHIKQVIQWTGSHHDQAMQEASPDTVLGKFNNYEFTSLRNKSRFYLKDNKYWVNTDNLDGTLQDFVIKYTFGVYPLQQYLIEMPDGRLQALDIAWDSRSKVQGGQRWFHLKDSGHWTGLNLNWNYMCADCHSTNLQKNYDIPTETYNTQWSELNVSCEACHGPGQAHQQWAITRDETDKSKGLTVLLDERKVASNEALWQINPTDGKPFRSVPRLTNTEIETCARCHSRRSQFDQPESGDAFLDNFRPALLTQGLYHTDGQIDDEVYVYGSFLQSKMYQAGVTCSDCHDPHIAGLKLPGDRVCNQCHLAEKYRTAQHHFHPASATSGCLDCHMTSKIYMGVDKRHDHSFRIPRPDLSEHYATPNACNQCHTDQTPQWATQQITQWYGDKKSALQKYTPVFNSQRKQLSDAEKKAIQLLLDGTQPAIAQATVLSQIVQISDERTLELIDKNLKSDDPMLRFAALAALSGSDSLDFDQIAQRAIPLLDDKTRLVRMEAASLLAPVDLQQLEVEVQKKQQKSLQEYIDSQLFNSERPESHFNLGNLYQRMKNYPQAESAYRQALKQQPEFVPAWVNLAQLYSDMNREEDALKILKLGLKNIPQSADIYHSLGLTQVRVREISEAILSLKEAAGLAPENAQYNYVYGIALNSDQRPAEALTALTEAHLRHPDNMEILSALVSINQDNGNREDALRYAEKILQLEPNNPSIQRFIEYLKNQ